jgi:hypothetical protein
MPIHILCGFVCAAIRTTLFYEGIYKRMAIVDCQLEKEKEKEKNTQVRFHLFHAH